MSELFNLVPEFEYIEQDNYKTYRTEFRAGTVQTRAAWPKPKRTFTLRWDAALTNEKEYAIGFFRDQVGSAGAFEYTPQDPLPPPVRPGDPGTQAQTVASYGSRVYFYQTTWHTAIGETTPSATNSIALNADTLFTLKPIKFPRGAIKCGIYVDTDEITQLQFESAVDGSTWVEPDISGFGSGLLLGDGPPTINTATETVLVHLLEDSFEWAKVSPVSYRMVMTFEEII